MQWPSGNMKYIYIHVYIHMIVLYRESGAEWTTDVGVQPNRERIPGRQTSHGEGTALSANSPRTGNQ